jgi:hypothetical protein
MDTAPVIAALHAYADAWRANAAAALVPHWAPDRFAFYKAEEVRRFYTAWPDVLAYWAQNEGLHDDIRLSLSNLQPIAPVPGSAPGSAPGLAMVAFDMTWDIRFRPDARLATGQPFHHAGRAMGGFNHVLAMLVETPLGWKLTGWSETPDAAITYMTDLYYRTASPDFRPQDRRP